MARGLWSLLVLCGACQLGCGRAGNGSTSGAPGAGAALGVGGAGAITAGAQAFAGGGGGGGGAGGSSEPEPEPDPNLVAFECRPEVPALGPRRIARLNASQFSAALKSVFDALDIGMPGGIAPPFDYVNPADRFSTYTRSYGMNDAELTSAWETATFAADTLAVGLLSKRACLADAAGLEACMLELAEDAGAAAFRRPLESGEAAALVAPVLAQAAELGTQEVVATLLHHLLLSPEFLFRSELGDPASAQGAKLALSSEEQAAAVAFTLQAEPPDAALVAAAALGPSELGAEVVRRMAELAELASVTTMVREYFRYAGAVNIFKDPELLPDAHRVDLVKDTDTLVSKVLESNGHQRFFESLLTWPDVWVSQDTYRWYDISQETKTHEKQLRTPPAATRLGILSQPSFLVAYSDMAETKPVQRGRFLLESMLCISVPELPIGMVPKLPDLGPDAPQRQRLGVHTEQVSCQGCHRLMDPLGLAFEQFDDYGRFRTAQGPNPIEAGGMLTGSLDRDGAFTGALDLIQKISESEGALQCFVRHSFRYWMGRGEREADGCALVAARDAYSASGGDYAALVAALFSSASFRERTTSEGAL